MSQPLTCEQVHPWRCRLLSPRCGQALEQTTELNCKVLNPPTDSVPFSLEVTSRGTSLLSQTCRGAPAEGSTWASAVEKQYLGWMLGPALSWLAHIKMQQKTVAVALACSRLQRSNDGLLTEVGTRALDNIVALMFWSGPTVACVQQGTVAIHSFRQGAENRPTATHNTAHSERLNSSLLCHNFHCLSAPTVYIICPGVGL